MIEDFTQRREESPRLRRRFVIGALVADKITIDEEA